MAIRGWRWVLAVALLWGLAQPVAQARRPGTDEINRLADRYHRSQQRRSYRPSFTPQGNAAWLRELGGIEQRLAQIRPAELDPQGRITHRMLRDELALQRRHVTGGWLTEDVNAVEAPWQGLILSVTDKKRRTVRDWRWAIKTLGRAGRFMDGYIGQLQRGLDAGRVRSADTIRCTIEALAPLASRRRGQNPFLELEREIATSLAGRPELPELQRELSRVLRDEVLPAHRTLRRFLQRTYLPRAGGVGTDRERYLYHMARHLGADHPSPEALGRWGRLQVRHLRRELDRSVHQLDPKATGVGRVMRRLNRSRFSSGAELVAAVEREIDAARRQTRAMAPIPRSRVVVKPVPPHEEATTAAAYWARGDREGEMQVNTGVLLAGQRPHEMATLVTHEVWGGHHMAAMYARKQRGLPKFRRERLDTAFDEGWALYAEQWRDQRGGFTPAERVGYLVNQLWRAARLVVDTGLHTGTMTRDQAIDYFQRNTFVSRTDAVAEIDRYINWPGQALAYAYGKRQILRTRREVERILGKGGFDERAFHARLLSLGPVPLAEAHTAMLSWARRRAGQLRGATPGSPARTRSAGRAPASP